MYVGVSLLRLSFNDFITPNPASFAHNQWICMFSTLEQSPVSHDVCTWNGVECNDSTIESINWHGKQLKSLEFLPPGLVNVSITRNLNPISLFTRFLPKELQTCRLNSDRLLGHVDMTCLPQPLVSISLASNFFVGTVCLVHLPKRLENINFHGNNIERVIADRSYRLPVFFKEAVFSPSKPNYVIKANSVDGKRVDRRIVVHKSIHK